MIGVKIWKHFGKEICGQKKQSTMIYLSNIFCIAIASRDSSFSTGSVSIPLGKSLDEDNCTHQGYDEMLHFYIKLTMFSLK